jgi:flavin-binding protein dodecin
MSIVPSKKQTLEWMNEWQKIPITSDTPHSWDFIANRAAEWALRRAASECDELEYFRAAEVIRALISPEGKLKGGESDGQG